MSAVVVKSRTFVGGFAGVCATAARLPAASAAAEVRSVRRVSFVPSTGGMAILLPSGPRGGAVIDPLRDPKAQHRNQSRQAQRARRRPRRGGPRDVAPPHPPTPKTPAVIVAAVPG